MGRVIHFEFPSSNLAASRKFYQAVFDWKLEKWDGPEEYWLVETGERGAPGINGALYTPGGGLSGTVNTVEVDDLDEAVAKVLANGGSVVRPRVEIPGVGSLVYVMDPGGAVMGVMQSDPNRTMM